MIKIIAHTNPDLEGSIWEQEGEFMKCVVPMNSGYVSGFKVPRAFVLAGMLNYINLTLLGD